MEYPMKQAKMIITQLLKKMNPSKSASRYLKGW